MEITVKEYIKSHVIKNLLKAHERLSEQGSIKELVKLTKLLLSLAENSNDEILYLWLEENNHWGCKKEKMKIEQSQEG